MTPGSTVARHGTVRVQGHFQGPGFGRHKSVGLYCKADRINNSGGISTVSLVSR